MSDIEDVRRIVMDAFEEALGHVPDQLRIYPDQLDSHPGTTARGFFSIHHPLLDGRSVHPVDIGRGPGPYDSRTGWPDPPHTKRLHEIIADYRRRAARLADFGSIRSNRANLECRHPWTRWESAPSWTLATHPLLAHALRANDANDFDHWTVAPTQEALRVTKIRIRVRQAQDMLIGYAPLHSVNREAARSALARRPAPRPGRTGSGRSAAPYRERADTGVAPGSGGRRPGQRRPRTRRDRAVDDRAVCQAVFAGGLRLQFRPCRAVPCAPVPDGVDAPFHGRDMPWVT